MSRGIFVASLWCGYYNDKVINAYRNMGFETMEDDAEAVIPTLSDVRALHSDYAGDCKFMFRDVE